MFPSTEFSIAREMVYDKFTALNVFKVICAMLYVVLTYTVFMRHILKLQQAQKVYQDRLRNRVIQFVKLALINVMYLISQCLLNSSRVRLLIINRCTVQLM